MGASLERIRESMNAKPTPKGKGLVLELRLVAYDNGLIELDGIPINVKDKSGSADAAQGWLGAASVALETINEFRRQFNARQKQSG